MPLGNQKTVEENKMQTQYDLTKAQYRQFAPWYDAFAAPALKVRCRNQAVSLLGLRVGDVVVDAACGTGGSFPLIEEAIGPTGYLVGVDVTPEMLRKARGLIGSHGWDNVTLINAPVEEARIDGQADAFLFSFAHDVLQSPHALKNLFDHAKQGARVAACGIKVGVWWNTPLNFAVMQVARQYHTVQEGLSEPWRHLRTFVPDLDIRLEFFDTVYVVSGTLG